MPKSTAAAAAVSSSNKTVKKTLLFAQVETECKCHMGHNLGVLEIPFKSKTCDGRSKYKFSVCCEIIGAGVQTAKGCGYGDSLECMKSSIMCCDCFEGRKHNTQLLLCLA
jgi:hypothetical protein